MPEHSREPSREPRGARPGHHDPTYRMAGAAPARSALTLRLVLATFGLVVCGAGAVVLAVLGEPAWQAIILALLAGVALVDVAVIARRRSGGEPG